MERWTEVLRAFVPASSEMIALRELRRRTDSKFVVPPDTALQLVRGVARHYAVVSANGEQLPLYRTLYFDTENLECFHDHRRGRRVRNKIRVRDYPDRQLTILEVKTRKSDAETVKSLRARPFGDHGLGPDDRSFVATHTGIADPVGPQLWTTYRRVTLVGIATPDRVTIDLDLRVDTGGRTIALSSNLIIEVKQWPFSRATPIMAALRAGGWRECSISKYCAAIAATRPQVRCNRLLPALHTLRHEFQ